MQTAGVSLMILVQIAQPEMRAIISPNQQSDWTLKRGSGLFNVFFQLVSAENASQKTNPDYTCVTMTVNNVDIHLVCYRTAEADPTEGQPMNVSLGTLTNR